MDDYGTQDTSTFSDSHDSNAYNYNDNNDQGYSHQYEIDKSDSYFSSKENRYSELSDQSNTNTNMLSSSNNDTDFADIIKDALLPESQDLTPQSETENSKWLEDENYNSDNTNLQGDEYQSTINQQSTINDTKFINENESADGDDCCSCKNQPFMCLAVFCECLCL